jgi:hypothetical protein
MCECKVGPGKFEGESALTFLAYQSMLLGCSDESHGSADFFKGPLDFDADAEMVAVARDYGYCEPCIEGALAERPYGMSIWESDQGFVYGTTYDDAKAYDKAVAQAEADDESEDDYAAY